MAEVKPLRPTQPAYPVTWVADAVLDFSAPSIIKGLIEPGAFVVIYGPSGSGKSFFTADIAEHIATGAPWRGKKTMRGLVVYVASEAGASILKRFVGWRENRLGESADPFLPLAVLTRGPNLLNMVDVEKLTEQLQALQLEAKLPLALVIFDTLSRSIPGGDENSAEDMTMAVNAADYLREKFNVATAYVHHTGKDPAKGARGHSAIFAAADLVIGISDGQGTVEKIRDGVAGERFGFRLEPIEIGRDSDGDAVMTCLLNPADGPVGREFRQPTGKNQRMMYSALQQLVSDHGKQMPGTSVIPAGVKAVSYESLVERLLPKMPDLKAFTARQRLSSAAVSLQESGFVGVHGDLIWLL